MASTQSPSLLGTGDTSFGVITFGTTYPLLGQNDPLLNLPLTSGLALCAAGIQGEKVFWFALHVLIFLLAGV